MAGEILTDEQVEHEIRALCDSEYVKLAQKDRELRQKRKLYLRYLQHMENKGRALAEAGVTMHSIVCQEQIEEAYLHSDWMDELFSAEECP